MDQYDDIQLKVVYGTFPDSAKQGAEFGVPFEWDIPLTDGYSWTLVGGDDQSTRMDGYGLKIQSDLFKTIKKEVPDILIVTGWQSSFLIQAALFGKYLGIPLLIRGEANNIRDRTLIKKLIHKIYLRIYDGYLYIGSNNKEYYKSIGVPEHILFSTPYCVDNEKVENIKSKTTLEIGNLKQKYGLDPQKLCFLFSGKLINKKRLKDILEAIRMLNSSGYGGFQLLVVGDGELKQSLNNYVISEELDVVFAGFINQKSISEIYSISDCLILPSDSGETWGLVVNEAMASGCSIIVSDHVGCAIDLVYEKETGYIFRMGNIKELSSCMAEILDDEKRLQKYKYNARKLIKNHYSILGLAEKTRYAIHRTLDIKGGPLQ